MGLLDDAIREHLELKRRHGADPDEVSRQEREALGAPVRGEFAKPAGDAPADQEEAPEPVGPEGATEVAGVPEIDEPPEMPGAPETEDEPEAAAAEPGTEEDPWLVEDLADPDPEPEPEPEPAPEPEPEAPAPEPERPAARAAGAEAPEGEDVLEETPEFLQETPEHDRLWFEQKPPRGFDWDK